jgi:hypothetical protein
VVTAETDYRVGKKPRGDQVRGGDRDARACRDELEILVKRLSKRRIKRQVFCAAGACRLPSSD